MRQISIRKSHFGKGVFAKRDFSPGETLFKFSGRRITSEEAGNPLIEKYVVQIDIETYINTRSPGKYINHSCDPNAGLKDPRTLVAIKEIKKGQEIFFDYSTCILQDPWTMECHCGSAQCRHLIADFNGLESKLKNHYLHLGVAPLWLWKK